MAEDLKKLSAEVVSSLIEPIIERTKQFTGEVINRGIDAANSIVERPAPAPELRGGYETSQNADQSLLSEQPEEEPPSVVVEEEERAEEEEKEKPVGQLSPMVLKNPKIDPATGLLVDDRMRSMMGSSANPEDNFFDRMLELASNQDVLNDINMSDKLMPQSYDNSSLVSAPRVRSENGYSIAPDLSKFMNDVSTLASDPAVQNTISTSDQLQKPDLSWMPDFMSNVSDLANDRDIMNQIEQSDKFTNDSSVPDIAEFVRRSMETGNPLAAETAAAELRTPSGFPEFLDRTVEIMGNRDEMNRSAEAQRPNMDVSGLRSLIDNARQIEQDPRFYSLLEESARPSRLDTLWFNDNVVPLTNNQEVMQAIRESDMPRQIDISSLRDIAERALELAGDESVRSAVNASDQMPVMDVDEFMNFVNNVGSLANNADVAEAIRSSDQLPVLDLDEFSDFINRTSEIMSDDETAKMIGKGDVYGYASPENFNKTGVALSDENRNAWQDFYNSEGGVDDDYVSGSEDMLGSIMSLAASNRDYDSQYLPDPNIDAMNRLSSGLDKIAREKIDDGTMHEENIKSKYMTGEQYKKYIEAGFGGRPIDEIEDGMVYNKFDEMMDYGFKPYIQDLGHLASWELTQGADDITKGFNTFGDLRDLMTNEYYNYGDQRIERDRFLEEAGKWWKTAENTRRWSIPMDDGSVEYAYHLDEPKVGYADELEQYGISPTAFDPDSIILFWPDDPDGKIYIFPDYDDYKDTFLANGSVQDIKQPFHNLEYTQSDGTTVSMSPEEALNFMESISNNEVDTDYGPFNLGKDVNERKDFTTMFSTGDFSDMPPGFVDLVLGSAPLFFRQTAWPMAISNAVTASQGLDPLQYDYDTNTYMQLSGRNKDTGEDYRSGDKYIANLVLSGLVPATEHVAGVLGGGSGIIGKPIQNVLGEIGAPGLIRALIDIAGEGVEEDVASVWEDAQVNGLRNWYANQMYERDENGDVVNDIDPATGKLIPRVLYDTSGHEIRDPNTSAIDRIGNLGEGLTENFLAGTVLGGVLGAPKIATDAVTGQGYFDKYLRDAGRYTHDVDEIRMGPEMIGTYGQRRR